MAEIIKRIDLSATLSGLQEGESIIIETAECAENNIRQAANRIKRKLNRCLTVSVNSGDGKATVKRVN